MEEEKKELVRAQKEVEMDEDRMDYATLAKLGGRKDLLVHHEYEVNPNSKPEPYPWVEWFDHSPLLLQPTNQTSSADNDGSLSYVTNNFLAWPVSNDVQPSHAKQRRLAYPPPANRTKKPTSTKLPRLSTEPPLVFSKLLSMEYQKEWLDSNKRRLKAERIKQQEKRQIQKQKLSQHSMKLKKSQGGIDDEQKPRFIMKRFLNVPAKLKLPPV